MKYCFQSRKFINTCQNTASAAIICRQRKTNWSELQHQVAEFSDKLLAKSSARQPLVIYGHKEHEFVVAMLAAHSLNLPFIPVDKAYPRNRLDAILQQLGAGTLFDLTESEAKLGEFCYSDCSLTPQQVDDTAYIMFTSGSTGKPKGVPIKNSALNNYVDWITRDFEFCESSVILNQALFSFDISILDLVGSMSSGGSMLLVDEYFNTSPSEFLEYLQQHRCTDWNSTPSFVTRWLLARDFNKDHLPSLKRFILIGEALLKPLVDGLHQRFDEYSVWNSYGPTEATVAVTLICLDKALLEKTEGVIPIGRAKSDSEIYLIDSNGCTIEQDAVEGELVIVGDNVAQSYLDPTISANCAFFTSACGKPAYKTGDIGYVKDGLLYFSGRKDDQIKLNGFRIEVDEIKQQLLNLPLATNAEVIPLVRAGKVIRLVGVVFYSQDKQPELFDQQDIKQQLAAVMPHYMVPSEIIAVDAEKAPYNNNHKVDKKVLNNWYIDGSISSIQIQ